LHRALAPQHCQGGRHAVSVAERGKVETYWLITTDGRDLGDPGHRGIVMNHAVRRWRPLLLLIVLSGGVLWGGWRWREVRRHHRVMAEIEREMEKGLHGTAARKLSALLTREPDWDQALYLLGTCERARGQPRAAEAAWTRIQPPSQFAPRAILGRVELKLERGRLAAAEQIVEDARNDPRIDAASLPFLLGPVYCQQARLEEAERLIEARWQALDHQGQGASGPAINLVRACIELRRKPVSVAVIRSALDQAARLAPEDDRVWLGKANLAIRIGSYDEAARWLLACLRQRPEDVPVWRARLNWAVATNRVSDVREALEHLAADESTPAQVERLTAWLAARRGDPAGEQRALERLIAVEPADLAAWDRLAELAVQGRQPAQAALLRAQKVEVDRLTARYHRLYQRNQPIRDAREMARLAERLGRWFEARAFLTVATAVDPGRDELRRELARLEQHARTIPEPGRTLAEVLAADLEATLGSSASPTTSRAAQDPSSARIPIPNDLGRTQRFSERPRRVGGG
jgi:tetratricopeptide (TPR) repeat protein